MPGFFKKPKWLHNLQKGTVNALESTGKQVAGGMGRLSTNIQGGAQRLSENYNNIAHGKLPTANDVSNELNRAGGNISREAKNLAYAAKVNINHMTPEQKAALIAAAVAVGGYALVVSSGCNWSIAIATKAGGEIITVPIIGSSGSGALIVPGAAAAAAGKTAYTEITELKIDHSDTNYVPNINSSPTFYKEKIIKGLDPILDKTFDQIVNSVDAIAAITCGVYKPACVISYAITIGNALFGNPRTIGEVKTAKEEFWDIFKDQVKGKLKSAQSAGKVLVGYTWEKVEFAVNVLQEAVKKHVAGELIQEEQPNSSFAPSPQPR